MRSATPTPSKPFSRNSRAAVSTTRALFSATFSFVIRMAAVRPSRVDFDDIRHQTMMSIIINIPLGRCWQGKSGQRMANGRIGEADMVAQALTDRLSPRGYHDRFGVVA